MRAEIIDAMLFLETLGYSFTLDGDWIRFSHQGTRPDPAIVRPLLELIKAHRDVAMDWLRNDAEAFRMDCQFHAAERAVAAARQAEMAGDRKKAKYHLMRFARLFAAGAVAAGETEPYIPWDIWIQSFDFEIEDQKI